MTVYQPFLLFIILILLSAYWRRRERAAGRRGIRQVTGYGVVLCVFALNLWLTTRFEDILGGFTGPREASIFATPWLWVSALCIGIALLIISFFTRESRRDAA